jgi:methyl-accepting chemotaxis protein
MLNIKRGNAVGRFCGDVWKAGICNTPNCGVECLNHGKSSTLFNQAGFDFKVDAAYLNDKNGKRTGHIEIVQNVTELLRTQRAQSELVEGIKRSISSFASASHEIATMSEAMAKDSVEHASKISIDVTAHTKKSNEQMQEMLKVMTDINDASSSIGAIITLIDGIARQTNILALNASVEAVRVGEAGRGFAVVAEEVRDLATKSANAAHNATTIIKENITLAMQGVENSRTVHESLGGISEEVRQVNMLLSEISTATEEQSGGIDQLAAAITQMEHATQSSAAVAEESSAAADELLVMSNNLEEMEESIDAMI